MNEKTGQWTEAERLAEIDRLHIEYRQKKRVAERVLAEMRLLRKQIDVVEDALIIYTMRRGEQPNAPQTVKELLKEGVCA